MQNKTRVVGSYRIGGLTIDRVDIEPCYRLSQYGEGKPITCQCTLCAAKNQTPEEAKAVMDKIYKH